MRILKVTQSYYPFLERGGPAVKVRSLALGMSAAGHDVTVLTADLGFTSATRELAHPVADRWGLRTVEEGVEAVFLRSSARYRALTWNSQISAFCRGAIIFLRHRPYLWVIRLAGPSRSAGVS